MKKQISGSNIGQLIRVAIKDNGIHPSTLAERLGVTYQAFNARLNNYDKGKGDIEQMLELAELLGSDIEIRLSWDEQI